MERNRENRQTRRRFLTIITLAGSAVVAGCSERSEDSSSDSSANETTPHSDAESRESTDESGNESTSDTDEPDESDDKPDCPDEEIHTEYESTPIRILRDGEELGSVTVSIADTSDTRRIGLSETDCLPEDRGMLFVYDASSDRNFWMIDMDFGIDIIYVAPDGRINSIHHAPAPDSDESGTETHHQYAGEGQYILEVPYRWTERHGVETGDRVDFEL